MRDVLNIEDCKIVVPEGPMRPVNAARMEVLLDSIRKIGLLQPLVVGGPNAHQEWPLVDGAHRPAALKKLKYRVVPCLSMRGDKDMRRLAEIDANLLRSPLTRLERLEHLAERELLEKQMRLKLEHGGALAEAEAEKIGMSARSKRRASRFHKRLSAEERSRLKGTAVANRDKDLFALANIGDIQQRTAVIDALSDAEKPAPSLYEAKCRAGLAPHLEPDLEREFERGANRLFDSLFYGRTGTLERFLRKVAADEPDFVDIMTDVVKRLTERGGES